MTQPASLEECEALGADLTHLLGELAAALAEAPGYAALAIPLGEFVAHFTGALPALAGDALLQAEERMLDALRDALECRDASRMES